MKFLNELFNRLRGADQSAADAIKDPVLNAKLSIEDSKKQINDYTAKIHELMTDTNVLAAKVADAKAQVAKFDAMAQKFAAANDRERLTEAIKEKQQAQVLVDSLSVSLAANTKQQDQLRALVAAARDKVAKAEVDVTRLSASITSSKIRTELAKAPLDLTQTGKGLGALDQIAEEARKAEAGAQAWETLAADTPEAKLADLEKAAGSTDAGVNDEVEKMLAAANAGKPA